MSLTMDCKPWLQIVKPHILCLAVLCVVFASDRPPLVAQDQEAAPAENKPDVETLKKQETESAPPTPDTDPATVDPKEAAVTEEKPAADAKKKPGIAEG